jgi:signal transduction histidine kinase
LRIGIRNLESALRNIKEPYGIEDSEGIETFTTLRDGGSTAPIVVLTGFDDETVAVQAVREGAQDYLVKGKVDVDLLVRAIRYAIERQRTLTELENANRQISDFTAMMVHDLRSPLVNVIAIGDMVNDGLFGPLNDEQKNGSAESSPAATSSSPW